MEACGPFDSGSDTAPYRIWQYMGCLNFGIVRSAVYLLGAWVAYLALLVFYRLYLHPLRRFPGPKLAAATGWYAGYWDLHMGGQMVKHLADLHKEYG